MPRSPSDSDDPWPPAEDRWELEPVVLEYPYTDNPQMRVPEVDEEEP